jgi:hypothetical protein
MIPNILSQRIVMQMTPTRTIAQPTIAGMEIGGAVKYLIFRFVSITTLRFSENF